MSNLTKSHSKSSNARLTFACLIGLIFLLMLFFGLCFFIGKTESYILIACGSIGLIFNLILINSFKR